MDTEKGKEVKRLLSNWSDEMNSAELYRLMSGYEKNDKLSDIYRRLASVEEGHAETWASRLKDAGVAVPVFKPSWRTRVLGCLALRLGVHSVLPTLSSLEKINSGGYAVQQDARDMVPAELSHAILLNNIAKTAKGGIEGGILAKLEGRHRAAGGNALRAAVLGASDGLLSNFSLLMGVAGAAVSERNILLTGIAGLLAGGISMALGEWISVQSSRELYSRQLETEEQEIALAPEEEVEELVLIYQARGLEETSARSIATHLMGDKGSALETLAREELGIDPGELGGSAWEAAFISFLLFATGAVVPVLPYLFMKGMAAIAVSAVFSAAGLFLVGASITLFTGRSVLYSGARQVIIGLCAAAVTFLVGHFIGVSIA